MKKTAAETTQKRLNLYEKLQEARVRLAEMGLKKSGKNAYGGYSYYELADFLPAVQKIARDLRFSILVNITEDGARATLTLVDSEKASDHIVFSCPLSTAQLKACHPVQNLGAALTYTRRYLYTMAFEIVEADMVNGAPAEKPASPKAQLEQLWRQAGFTQPLEDYVKQCAKTTGLSGDALYTKALESTRHYCKTKGVGQGAERNRAVR